MFRRLPLGELVPRRRQPAGTGFRRPSTAAIDAHVFAPTARRVEQVDGLLVPHPRRRDSSGDNSVVELNRVRVTGRSEKSSSGSHGGVLARATPWSSGHESGPSAEREAFAAAPRDAPPHPRLNRRSGPACSSWAPCISSSASHRLGSRARDRRSRRPRRLIPLRGHARGRFSLLDRDPGGQGESLAEAHSEAACIRLQVRRVRQA